MTSPHPSSYGRRNPSSHSRYTPDRISYSPSSAYSEASGGRSHNAVAAAARSVAGAFIACFTPPETKSSKSVADSEEFKAHSVKSEGSASRSERRRSSNYGIYTNQNKSTHGREPPNEKFTIDEILKATRNFAPPFKIGQGGFGTVYKGRLSDGTFVALKRAKKSAYDKQLGVQFQSEVRTLAQVEHLNLVKFHGFLEHEDERIVIVEYVPNGTLREHLDCLHGNILDFAARLDIAIDVAHAITYLHMYTDHPIIHRDIKSSNILLTENFRAKVADFGFARLAADSDSGATHVSTQVKGTAGYLDPEYLRTYQLTEKSDVYSFGVLLVELATGRRPIEAKRELKERITAKWAMKKFADGDALSTLDPRLEHTAANNLALEKLLELALQCLAPRRQNRPNMRRCAEVLWSIRKDYRELSGNDFRSFSTRSQRSTSTRDE
ncbi:putative leucine-rich repeat receptor-like protein kinase [Morus notabilis]|uniref:non-specific serine/threonine protein kinase n=1 Tax=Morus notabilis TaxID=981085 RepID=W9SK14_9ROSA|nr:calmodulin-binding receptor-like cytoplasmic kinase 2 [Morus notabilis]EXC35100.1 putative leucine-rich repeat receptor-like protein kinase [Morus notabilis]